MRGRLKLKYHLRWLFLCLQKNRASPNFAQSGLARLPNFRILGNQALYPKDNV